MCVCVIFLFVCFVLSHASECKAGHFGGGAGTNGHRLFAWWFWLLEKRRRDVKRGRLCQQGSAGGRHTGEEISQTGQTTPSP